MRPLKGSMISTISRTMGVGVKYSPTLGAFGDGELAEEVLVDLAEGVTGDVGEHGVDGAQEAVDGVVAELLVGPGQHTAELGILLLDGRHGLVDGLPAVQTAGEMEQPVEPCLIGEVQDALSLVFLLGERVALRRLGSQDRVGLGEAVIGELEEDQAQDGDAVLRRLEVGVGAQLVSRVPQVGGDVEDVSAGVGNLGGAAVAGHRRGTLRPLIWRGGHLKVHLA